ncbi:hypothetical protein C2S52_003125 [Perilla frutescens var. hirtella]|nr:hypothetical protein C2S52_003125 [Perilla frutescens var. hirtella]
MRLWKRASDALKDRSSLWKANLARRTLLRNPEIDKAVIRATTHHSSSYDRRSVDRVCEWLRLSPLNLTPILRSISIRLDKTHSWPVALKGLLLTHALINCKTPSVRKIGRLPFDLSAFNDGHSAAAKAWPFNAFVRAYYAFLDQKSATVFQLAAEEKLDAGGIAMRRELLVLQRLQGLADLLIEIKPLSTAAFVPLVLEVMDGIIVEIYDVYSRICRGIAIVLINIYSAGKAEATMALRLVQKATQQGDELSCFFEFCREIGVMNASEFPVIDRIPDEGIQELEQIIEGFSVEKSSEFRTIITQEWEKFDEDGLLQLQQQQHPDLITFM